MSVVGDKFKFLKFKRFLTRKKLLRQKVSLKISKFVNLRAELIRCFLIYFVSFQTI